MAQGELDNANLHSSIGQAVLAPAHWETVLSEIGRTLGAVGGAIFNPAPGTHLPLHAASGIAQAALLEYARDWLGRDAWINSPRYPQLFREAGDIAVGTQALTRSELHMTDFYADFMRHHDIESILSLQVADDRDPLAPTTFMSFYRPASSDNFGDAERAQLASLWPQLRRAVHAHWLLERSKQLDRMAEASLNALPDAALVLRPDGTIDFANEAAMRLLPRKGWLTTRDGRLRSVGTLKAGDLAQWIKPQDRPGVGALVIAMPTEPPSPAALYFVPLSESPAYALRWPHARVLLLVRLPPTPESRTRWAQCLAEHYGLTPAELRVLERLVRGLEPKRIATDLGVSYDTIRTHLRKLLEKTGCNRQAELVLLATSI